jgi:hypothetical protein
MLTVHFFFEKRKRKKPGFRKFECPRERTAGMARVVSGNFKNAAFKQIKVIHNTC